MHVFDLELPRLVWEDGVMRQIFEPQFPDPDYKLPGPVEPDMPVPELLRACLISQIPQPLG